MDITTLLHDFVSDEDVFIPALIASGVVIIVLISGISKTIQSVARERTKREIAAYIAEGSMTPEQGERLVKSGSRFTSC
ncbi:MAG: hypothetical protein AAGI53_07250 [Planctomycetota bacterium]